MADEVPALNPNAPDSQESFVKNSFLRFLETCAAAAAPHTNTHAHTAARTGTAGRSPIAACSAQLRAAERGWAAARGGVQGEVRARRRPPAPRPAPRLAESFSGNPAGASAASPCLTCWAHKGFRRPTIPASSLANCTTAHEPSG